MSEARLIEVADGIHLNVVTEGPRGAPWVVFSNSVMTDLRIWGPQAQALKGHFQVLRYDQRGHGVSTVTDAPMDFSQYGADQIALLDHLGIPSCTFVGLSMGVPTGLAALSIAPDRFAGFVAVDGVARSAPGREGFWAERRDYAHAKGMAAIAEQTAPRWLPGVEPEAPVSVALKQMISATPVAGFAATTHALQSYDLSAAIDRIACPFLGLFGAQDGAMPESIRAQFAKVPGARFAGIPGAGHIPNFQCPDPFNTTLLAFLGGAPASIYGEPH